jgi:toxin ParE1/3/4
MRIESSVIDMFHYLQVDVLEQARSYLLGLHERFEALAEHPMQGRSAKEFAPELRRFDYQSHIVFYLPKDQGVRIVRVLHQSMDTKRHL